MSIAGTKNIIADQGADWRRDWILTDATGATCDLSGYTDVSAYCGSKHGDTAAIEMTCAFVDEDNPESLNGDTSGTIRVELTDTQTAAIDWQHGYYDVWLTEPSGDRIRIIQGQMTVRPKVTSGAA
jgi:hypothetical protein